jgi:hypothetical protein
MAGALRVVRTIIRFSELQMVKYIAVNMFGRTPATLVKSAFNPHFHQF